MSHPPVSHPLFGRLLLILGLILPTALILWGFPQPTTAEPNAPALFINGVLLSPTYQPVVRVFNGDTFFYSVSVFGDTTTGMVITATLPPALQYTSDNCGVGNATNETFIWSVGNFNGIVSCAIELTVAPTATGQVTLTAEVTADDYDPVQSTLVAETLLNILAPTSLIIQHTDSFTDGTNFTYTVSAPDHAVYATRIYTGDLSAPAATATAANGDVYVVDGGHYRIQKLNSGGQLLLQWGSLGTADGQFDGVNDIALDADGNVWVADQNNNRLQKFSSAGTHLLTVGSSGSGNGQFFWPWGLAIAPNGTIYVADHINSRIQYLDSDGNYLGQWGSSGIGPGEFTGPFRVAIAPDNSVYVTDISNGVQKFTADGTFIAQIGVGTADGLVNDPIGLAINDQGDVFVADSLLGRVQKFNAAGQFLSNWGRTGRQLGQISGSIRGLEWLGDDQLLVADTSNNLLTWFSGATTFALDDTAVDDMDGVGDQIAYHMPPTGTYTFTATAATSWQCQTNDTANPQPLINGPQVTIALDAGEQITCTATHTAASSAVIYLPFINRP